MSTINTNDRRKILNAGHKTGIIILLAIMLFGIPQLSQSETSNTKSENPNLYSVNHITDGNTVDFYPEFSPDGKFIVFSSKPVDGDDSSDLHLWMMDSDGKNRHEISSGKGMDLFPTFTPDGDKIIFVSNRVDGNWDICSIKVDGSNFTRLLKFDGNEYSPFVTPDGNNILFISKASGTDSVWTVGINGGKPKRLTSGGNGDHFPTMKAENKEIYFASTRVGMGDVWSIDVEKNIYSRLTYYDLTEGSPSLNRDGTKIAYTVKEGGEYSDFDAFDEKDEGFRFRYKVRNVRNKSKEGNVDIWLMDSDGTNKRQLTKNVSLGNWKSTKGWNKWSLSKIVSYYHLAWHPDGNKIALTTWDPGAKQGSYISVIEFDKENINKLPEDKRPVPEYTLIGEMELTKGEWDDFAPSFSPDGKIIMFSSNRSGNWRLWSIGVNGEGLKQVSSDAGDELASVFSPDGNDVAYLKPKADAVALYDIWIMKSDGGQAKQLTKDVSVVSYPEWSADGKEIAFVSRSGEEAEIWTHNIADHTQKKIAVIWDPSLKYNASDREQANNDIQMSNPYAKRWAKQEMEKAKRDKHPLAKKGAGGFGYPFKEFLYKVDFNSAGDKITFESNRSGNVEIWTMDINGANVRRISKGELPHWNPVFSPDGKKIAYSAERPVPAWGHYLWPDYNIWIADAETGKKVLLTGEEQIDWNPVWSPDGKKIAYVTNRSGEFEHFSIWMLYLK